MHPALKIYMRGGIRLKDGLIVLLFEMICPKMESEPSISLKRGFLQLENGQLEIFSSSSLVEVGAGSNSP